VIQKFLEKIAIILSLSPRIDFEMENTLSNPQIV
jgi:hypothetical protein